MLNGQLINEPISANYCLIFPLARFYQLLPTTPLIINLRRYLDITICEISGKLGIFQVSQSFQFHLATGLNN